jgi:23S rRNA (uracil1939-C5)-methyltransferase
VLELSAATLIYVSCEPASLARDLEKLVGAGYGIKTVQPFDMFPQTAEVENVVLLQR